MQIEELILAVALDGFKIFETAFIQIKDQFLLGDNILVAPVLEKGARTRSVVFPAGTWQGDEGSSVIGPCVRTINVPLARLPWYRLITP